MIDLCLRADSEAALAAALPMLRFADPERGDVWITAGLHHALDAGFAVETSPPVVAEDGNATTPAVFAPGYHANLRLLDGNPDRNAIVAAAEPFVVTPSEPQRGFAGGAVAAPVPAEISDRQFAQVLALDGVITQDEALAWAARGDLPKALTAALLKIPEADGARFGARMLLSAATTYRRDHPLVPSLGALLGMNAAALDTIWIRGAPL